MLLPTSHSGSEAFKANLLTYDNGQQVAWESIAVIAYSQIYWWMTRISQNPTSTNVLEYDHKLIHTNILLIVNTFTS